MSTIYNGFNFEADTSGGCETGGCSVGSSCEKMEVYDWLGNMEVPNGQKEFELIEVRFKSNRKELYRNNNKLPLNVGDVVTVEAAPKGYDVGVITLTGELVRIQQEKKYPNSKIEEFRKVLHLSTQEEVDKWQEGRKKEKDIMHKSRVLAGNLKLDMKISDVEFQGDLTKAIFYYIAEGRVDFRQLIKDMASEFHIKIEMRQIGARQEAARIGGIGPCGRELCCSTWLSDFRSVSTSAARYQQLSLNPQKLTGLCGKLKCCLNYELDMYLEGVKSFPNPHVKLKTDCGDATHVKTDIFKKVMWYSVSNCNSLLAIEPETVRRIQEINKSGKTITDLNEYALSPTTPKTQIDAANFISAEGDGSLDRLNDKLLSKKKKKKKRKKPDNSSDVTKVEAKVQSSENPEQKKNRLNRNNNRSRNNRRNQENRNDQSSKSQNQSNQ